MPTATIAGPTQINLSGEDAIQQGASWRRPFTYKTGSPLAFVDLTLFTARMTFRTRWGAPEIFTLTQADGLTLLGAIEFNIWAEISPARSALLIPQTLPHVYDFRLVAPGANGDVVYPFLGEAVVTPWVTLSG